MSFEDDLKISKGDDFSETADDIVLYVPRGGTQKRRGFLNGELRVTS